MCGTVIGHQTGEKEEIFSVHAAEFFYITKPKYSPFSYFFSLIIDENLCTTSGFQTFLSTGQNKQLFL
jgi:hypothetical protein